MPLLADGCRCHDSYCHWSRSSSPLTLSVCVTLRHVVSFILGYSYGCTCVDRGLLPLPPIASALHLPAHDHRRPLARDDELGNLHAPARLYGVSAVAGAGALLGAVLAGLAASKIGTGTSQPSPRLLGASSAQGPCLRRHRLPRRAAPGGEAGPAGVRVAVVEPDGLASPSADDVANVILYVLTQPPRVSIAELLIRPTG